MDFAVPAVTHPPHTKPTKIVAILQKTHDQNHPAFDGRYSRQRVLKPGLSTIFASLDFMCHQHSHQEYVCRTKSRDSMEEISSSGRRPVMRRAGCQTKAPPMRAGRGEDFQ